MADIGKAAGPQKGVHNGMKKYVRIGVAKKASLFGNTDASQNQGPFFIKAVHVIALPDAERAAVFPESLLQSIHIVWRRHFKEPLLSRNEFHRYAKLFQHGSIIGEAAAPGQKFHRPVEKSGQSALGRLGPEKAAALRRFHNGISLYLFNGINTGNAYGHRWIFPADGSKGIINGLTVYQRAGAIMDKNFIRFFEIM